MDKFDLPSTKRVFTGLWLGLLYIVCMFLVVYSLSTYQFQISLNSIPQNNSENTTKFEDHECDISGLKDNSMNTSLIEIPCIPNKPQPELDFYTTGQVLSIYKKMKDLYENKINLASERREQALGNVKELETKSKLKPEDENLLWEKKAAEGNLYRINLEILHLHDDRHKFMTKHENLVETFSDILYFENLFQIFSSVFKLDSFWALPKQILTIILILSMGVLGSLIFVTIEFLKNSECDSNIQCSMYIFRPFLGMIVALAMYVMVKSGQSTFGDATSNFLSPFLISFLGIISGMLAEQAYHRLVITGSSVINGNITNNNDSNKPREV